MRAPAAVGMVSLLLISGMLYGCASTGSSSSARRSGKAPPADAAIRAGMPEAEALQARGLYVLKCAKCHAFYDPEQYSDSEWSMWMEKMSEKAKLTSGEEALLNRYLQAFRQYSPK